MNSFLPFSIAALFAMLQPFFSTAQTVHQFRKAYAPSGVLWLEDFETTSDNGCVFVEGLNLLNSSTGLFKVDQDGNPEWHREFVSSNVMHYVAPHGQDIYVAVDRSGKWDELAKFDLGGNLQWMRDFRVMPGYNTVQFTGLVPSNTHADRVVASATSDWGNLFLFIEIDDTGSVVYSSSVALGNGSAAITEFQAMESGDGYVAFGRYLNSNTWGDYWMLRLDNNFGLMWSQDYSPSPGSDLTDVYSLPNDELLLCGANQIVHLDQNGNLLDVRQFDPYIKITDCILNGNYIYAAAELDLNDPDQDALDQHFVVIRMDQQLNIMQSLAYVQNGLFWAKDPELREAYDGNLWLAGYAIEAPYTGGRWELLKLSEHAFHCEQFDVTITNQQINWGQGPCPTGTPEAEVREEVINKYTDDDPVADAVHCDAFVFNKSEPIEATVVQTEQAFAVLQMAQALTVSAERDEAFTCTLWDTHGRQIARTHGIGRTEFSTSGLAAGIYILSIQQADTIQTQKLVIP